MCTVVKAHHEYRNHMNHEDLSKFLTQSHTNYYHLEQLKEQFELVTEAMERFLNEFRQTQHRVHIETPQTTLPNKLLTNKTVKRRRAKDSSGDTACKVSHEVRTVGDGGCNGGEQMRASLDKNSCGESAASKDDSIKLTPHATTDFGLPVPCY